MTVQEAIKATEKAAWEYRKATQTAARDRDSRWFNSTEQVLMRMACTEQVGRVTVTAGVGGNSRRQHCRHTFKIDGKRASFSEVMALLVTDQNKTVEVGLTGRDWEPTAATKFYAQCGDKFAFGPTEEAARAALEEAN